MNKTDLQVIKIELPDGYIAHIHVSIFGKKPSFENIKNQEDFFYLEYSKAKNYALKLLSKSAMPSAKLYKKLQEKLISDTSIKKVLKECERYGYLNDYEWASSFVRCERQKKHSSKIITMKLRDKGISHDIIEEIISDNQQSDLENIKRLLKTSYRSRDLQNLKEKNKVVAALIRKGFSIDLIREAISID